MQMTEKITNLHPKDDSSTTIYPNTKSECIIDKDISSYVSGHVPDSALVQKTTESIYTKLDTKIDDTKVELMKEINEVDSTLIDEINERENSDNLIRTDMETADKDLQSKITSLTTELSNETTERKNAISSIQEDLTTLDNSLLSTNGRVNTLENEMVNAHEDISSNKTNIETILSSYIDKSSAQTITGSKTFKQPIRANEIDNENGNAMLRYKETEGKNVVGGINYSLTLMGSDDRPTYSKDGSDFDGKSLALKSDVDSNWDLLMANLGIGRWRNIPLVWFEEQQSYLYDDLFPYFTSLDYYGLSCYPKSSNTTMKINLVTNTNLKTNSYFMAYAGNTDGTSSLIIESNLNLASGSFIFGYNYFKSITGNTKLFKANSSQYRPFYECPYLEEIGEFDMENVEFLSGLFASYSSKLKKISCKNWTSSYLEFSQWTLPAATTDTFVEIFSNLKDMTSSSTTHTIMVSSSVSLSDEQIKVATDKGWIVTKG